MSAYVVIVRDRTLDPKGMEMYKEHAKDVPTLKMKLLTTKTSKLQVLEGSQPESVVLMEFPTSKDALEWYNSEDYQAALPFRLNAADTRVVLVDGNDP